VDEKKVQPQWRWGSRGAGGDEGRRTIGSNNQVTCKEKMAVEEKGSSTLNNNI
jgi:hypothetical protein